MSNVQNAGNLGPALTNNYLPTLVGATDNPVVTYSQQIGRYTIIGNICFFQFKLVTTTMTKTTLTDALQVSLPFASLTLLNQVTPFIGRVENMTVTAAGITGEIASGSAAAGFRNYATAASSAPVTYAATAPGVGVLTTPITIEGSGWFEISAAA